MESNTASSPEQPQGAVDDGVVSAAVEHAPGAVPPTEGVPPRQGSAEPGAARTERSAAEDLADGLELMLRAGRKALRSFDPRIEQAAERAVKQLQQLDANALQELGKVSGIDPKKIEQAAEEAGRELGAVVERLTQRVDTIFRKPRE